MQLDFRHNLQPNGFSVYISKVDGSTEIVCRDTTAKDAAMAFWHHANNFSARCGIVDKVAIVDGLGATLLSWQFGRGYTFDGKTFLDKPVLMDS